MGHMDHYGPYGQIWNIWINMGHIDQCGHFMNLEPVLIFFIYFYSTLDVIVLPNSIYLFLPLVQNVLYCE